MFEQKEHIKLQGIYGKQKAIPAVKLKAGDVTIWNFGCTETIRSVTPTKTGKSIKCVIISDETGKEYTRTLRSNTLVVVKRIEKQPKNLIDGAIENKKLTYRGIYADVGEALDKFKTMELAEYYIQKYGDSSLRYFLEQQIIAAEINKLKEC